MEASCIAVLNALGQKYIAHPKLMYRLECHTDAYSNHDVSVVASISIELPSIVLLMYIGHLVGGQIYYKTSM